MIDNIFELFKRIQSFTANDYLSSSLISSIVTISVKATLELVDFLMEKKDIIWLKETIILNINPDILEYGDFKCLIIRFGTDQYLRDMADDKEKRIGRLRNEIINLSASAYKHEKKTSVNLCLPVHKRLGVQFKVFFDIKEQWIETEAASKIFTEFRKAGLKPAISSSPFHKKRIFILLPEFGTIETVDGIKNNMCFPI